MQYKIKPWAHQEEAIRKTLAQNKSRGKTPPGFALLWDPGTGKTGTAINILRHKFNEEKRILRTLIFCPPVVVENWRDEWFKHSNIDPAKVICLTGTALARCQKLSKHGYTHDILGHVVPQGMVFILNYESLIMPALYTLLRSWQPEVLVFDESHKLKNHSAHRAKRADTLANPRHQAGQAKQYTAKRPYTMILTGTPVLQNGMDLFMQYKILDGGSLLGDNFYKFRAQYCVDKNAGMPKHNYFPKWEMTDASLMEVSRLVKGITSVAKKSECMDLPPYITQRIAVGMLPEQAEFYRSLEEDLIAYLDAMPVSAPLAITKALRLMQTTAGFVNIDGEGTKSFPPTPKDIALKDLLEELTPAHKVIVWAVWKENYERIAEVCKKLKIDYVELHGEVSDKNRTPNIKRFNEDPTCRVLIGHPGSGGIGVNLVSASYSIFYSRTFSLEHSLQAEARNYRGGSEIHEKITRIDLVCENTIDSDAQKRLVNKQEIGDKVLRQIAQERKNA